MNIIVQKILKLSLVWLIITTLTLSPFTAWATSPEEGLTYLGADYSLKLPANYSQIDTPYADIAPSFTNGQSVVKVFVQPLGSQLSYESYINYGNQQLRKGTANFKIVNEYSRVVNNLYYRAIEYNRPPIKNRLDDKNFYKEVHLLDKNKHQVITIWAKSKDMEQWLMKADLDYIINNLKLGNNNVTAATPPSKYAGEPHINYKGQNVSLDIPVGKTMWGRFFPSVPFYQASYPYMLQSENTLEHKFNFIMSYNTFPLDKPFPEREIRQIYQDGRVFMLTLQPFDPENPDLNWVAVLEILAGEHDEALKSWAKGLARIDEPIFIRPLNEMNGDWDPWCTWFFGKDNDLYIEAWQYMYDIFKAEGGDKLYFVWNPHDRSYPDFTWNNPHLYYPGDDYVEWVGLTGYNNGTSYKADVWRGFQEIYDPLYADYLARYGDKPFMITEFSTNEVGGSKVDWLNECMSSLNTNRYPNIKIVNWFDGQDGPWLYQINSSPEALEAFRAGLKLENLM